MNKGDTYSAEDGFLEDDADFHSYPITVTTIDYGERSSWREKILVYDDEELRDKIIELLLKESLSYDDNEETLE